MPLQRVVVVGLLAQLAQRDEDRRVGDGRYEPARDQRSRFHWPTACLGSNRRWLAQSGRKFTEHHKAFFVRHVNRELLRHRNFSLEPAALYSLLYCPHRNYEVR